MKIAQSTRSLVLRGATVLGCVCALGALSACSDEGDEETGTGSNEPGMSFFVSSTTQDGNLGGLAGGDKICQDLAAAAGAGSRTWRAYLSVANNGSPIHAKDRIGSGPWFNSNGVKLADNLAGLHALVGNADLFITEKKEKVNGQWNGSNGMNGAPVNEHDIMSGSDATGSLIMTMNEMGAMVQTTCSDWTSDTLTPGPQVGHSDGMGPMMNMAEARFTSWVAGTRHAAAALRTWHRAGARAASTASRSEPSRSASRFSNEPMSPSEPLSQQSPGGAARLTPSAEVEAPALAASTQAELLYVVPDSERGVLYMYPPPPGTPRLSGQYQAHRVPITDARAHATELSLDVQGFSLHPHVTQLVDAFADAEVRCVYYPEMERLVRSVMGAAEVLVFDHNLRSASGAREGVYEPVRRVHNDYTHASARRRVRQLLGDAEAERRFTRRFAIVNVWRPLFGPVQDVPLAVCDGRSIQPQDLIAIDLRYRDRVGENFSFAYNPEHRWYYVPDMLANEALLLKCYDTASDGRCPFTAHSAFDHPQAPPGVRPRESIEIRTLAFFDTPARAG